MKKNVLPITLNKTYEVGQLHLESLNKNDGTKWQLPKLSEMITCLSLSDLKFGININNPYTWCQESIEGCRIAIKCESSQVLHINSYHGSNYNFIGIAPVWHF